MLKLNGDRELLTLAKDGRHLRLSVSSAPLCHVGLCPDTRCLVIGIPHKSIKDDMYNGKLIPRGKYCP